MISDGRDEAWSEITIRPDGRVYVFGLTQPLREILAVLPTREGECRTHLELQADDSKAAEPPGEPR